MPVCQVSVQLCQYQLWHYAGRHLGARECRRTSEMPNWLLREVSGWKKRTASLEQFLSNCQKRLPKKQRQQEVYKEQIRENDWVLWLFVNFFLGGGSILDNWQKIQDFFLGKMNNRQSEKINHYLIKSIKHGCLGSEMKEAAASLHLIPVNADKGTNFKGV